MKEPQSGFESILGVGVIFLFFWFCCHLQLRIAYLVSLVLNHSKNRKKICFQELDENRVCPQRVCELLQSCFILFQLPAKKKVQYSTIRLSLWAQTFTYFWWKIEKNSTKRLNNTVYIHEKIIFSAWKSDNFIKQKDKEFVYKMSLNFYE